MKIRFPARAIALITFFSTLASARTWTNVDGRQIEADFVKAEGEFVHLLLAGGSRKTVKVDISTLSQDDRDFITAKIREKLQEEFSDTQKYHILTDGKNTLSFPRINDARITYSLEPYWAFLTVKNRNGGEMEIPCEGSGAITAADSTDLDALAKKEAGMHSRNYDTTEIFDLPGGAKFLVYTGLKKGGKDVAERRCFLWQIIDGSLVRINFTNRAASRTIGSNRALAIITDTLQGLRLNTAVIPHIDIFQEILFGADTASFAAKLAKVPEETGPFELVRGGDKVSVPRVSGERLEQHASETQQSLHFQLEPKEPGVSDRVSMMTYVRLVEGREISEMLDKITESKTTGYDTYYIRDLPDGAKMIFLNKEGKRPSESYRRKAILYKKLRESVLQIELSEITWSENPHRGEDIRTISSHLGQVKVNGEVIDGFDVLVGACFADSSKTTTLQDVIRSLK